MIILLSLAVFSSFAGALNILTAEISLWGGTEVVNVVDDVEGDMVKITMMGPNVNNWFGIGFNGTDMNNTYAIVCGGKQVKCQENVLGYGAYGIELDASIKVTQSNDVNGVRFVTMERPRIVKQENGFANASYFAFPSEAGSVPIIACIGTTVDFDADSHMQNATVSTASFK